MPTNVKQLLDTANQAVPKITPNEVKALAAAGKLLIVDVRDHPEVSAGGKIKGALHVSRGMLDFRADPESPYHDKAFAKDHAIVLYCASGGRAALGGKLLKDLGYEKVFNLGSFKEWVATGGEIEPA